MTAPDRDEEFEAFLKRRTVLSTPVDKLEPPPRLDARILNQAREAIHVRREPARAARWARPVALAATILLCLSVVVNVTLNTRHPAEQPGANLEGPSPAAAPANTNKPVAAAAPEAPPPSPAAEKKSAANLQSDAMAARPHAPAPTPEQSNRDYARGELRRQLSASASEAQKPSPRPVARRDAIPSRGAASASATPSPEAKSTSAASARAESAPAEPPQGPVTPAEALDADGRQAALMNRAAGPQQAPHPQDPKVWLQQIETLRSQGRQAQADAEMQRFRATFPTYRLPAPSTDRP